VDGMDASGVEGIGFSVVRARFHAMTEVSSMGVRRRGIHSL